MTKHDGNLVWIDMEMTGLDPETCKVLEIATIVTDPQLNVLAEGPVIAVHQPDAILDGMDEWCTRVHGNSGLTARCRESQIDEAEAGSRNCRLRAHTKGFGSGFGSGFAAGFSGSAGLGGSSAGFFISSGSFTLQ